MGDGVGKGDGNGNGYDNPTEMATTYDYELTPIYPGNCNGGDSNIRGAGSIRLDCDTLDLDGGLIATGHNGGKGGTAGGSGGAGGGTGGQRPGQGGHVEWGGMPPFWVWTTYSTEDSGTGSAGFDPFEVIFGQTPRKSAAELAEEAQRTLSLDLKVLAGKVAMLALCALTGNLAIGMFTYAIITFFYSFYRSNSGCGTIMILPLIMVFGPVIALLAPRAGVQVTAGSVTFFAFALYWDFQTIRRDKETRDNLRAKVQGNAAN